MDVNLADTAVPYNTSDLFKRLGINIQGVTLDSIKRNAKSVATKTTAAEIIPANDTIIEGNRNNALTSLAGALRRKGMGAEVIQAALIAANDTQINPPLPEVEVHQIITSIMRYPSSDDSSEIMQSLNDVGNAQRFKEMHQGQLGYVLGWEMWMIWQDSRWIKDNYRVHVMLLAKNTTKAIFNLAALQTDVETMRAVSRHANNSHNAARIKAMLDLASHDPLLCVPAQELDANQMLLGVANGIANLKTGELELNHPDNLITRYSNALYDHDAKCPVFLEFLGKIFNRDKAKIAFIQRLVGYCITGRTDEQVFFFFFGNGANGKTTLLRIIELLLGSDMAKQTPAETLMAKTQGNKQSNDLARLQGVRTVIANEVEDGSLLAESLVKQLTGGDTVTARYLFKEFVEFLPVFKLIIAGNHKPIIKGTDNGIWRRLIMVGFPVSIPKEEQDPDLLRKLEAELPGILNWAIEGCREWQKLGLAAPESVTKDASDYREEMDWLGQWMADCCIVGESHAENATKLYCSFKGWAECSGIHSYTATAFGRRLAERGISKTRRADGQWYNGLSIKKPM